MVIRDKIGYYIFFSNIKVPEGNPQRCRAQTWVQPLLFYYCTHTYVQGAAAKVKYGATARETLQCASAVKAKLYIQYFIAYKVLGGMRGSES